MDKNEVIEIAKYIFDIEEADQYHDSDEVLDSGNRWITEKLTRFAAEVFQPRQPCRNLERSRR